MLPVCGDNLARTIAWLADNRYSVYGPHKGQQPATVDHLRCWRSAAAKAELDGRDACDGRSGRSGRKSVLEPETRAGEVVVVDP